MPELTTVQIDTETREMLRKLANDDFRSMAAELQWLVFQEWAHRFSQPNPSVGLAEAEAAGENIRK